jgi:hypothetical protein
MQAQDKNIIKAAKNKSEPKAKGLRFQVQGSNN